MRLSYNKTFQGLKIVGLASERCHATREQLLRVYFQLSEPPPLGWGYIFTTVWRTLDYPMKRRTGVERDTIWVDCILQEIETIHLKPLENAVAQTNAIYQQEARQQARDEVRQAQLHLQARSELEELSRTLYPVAPPRGRFASLFSAGLRLLWPGRKPGNSLPTRRAAALEPAVDMRDYHHGRFQGAALTPDAQSLSLDYIDHDHGGTQFCFRYVLSLHAPPRLVSGFTHEHSRLDYEIPFERIPRHVLSTAAGWLASRLEVERDKPLARTMAEFLKALRARENAAQNVPVRNRVLAAP